jgi:hypothetical protein
VKGIEDRLSGIPVVGDAINARRLEGLQKMNAKAFDRALEPVGGKVDGKFGEEAVAHAQDQVSGAFSKALAGKSAGLDHGFIVDATKAKMGIEQLPDSVRGEVNNQIDHVINNYFDDSGQISGENMQALLRELGGIKRGYQGNPLGHRIGKVVDQFTDSVENLFRRQAPDVMPQYDAAKTAFRRVSILEDAVNRGKNTGGVFTPAQLGMVDRANAIKFSGRAPRRPARAVPRIPAQHAGSAAEQGSGQRHGGRLLIPARSSQELAPEPVTARRGCREGPDPRRAARDGLQPRGTAGAYRRRPKTRKRGARGGTAVRKAAPLIGHGVGAATALGTARD